MKRPVSFVPRDPSPGDPTLLDFLSVALRSGGMNYLGMTQCSTLYNSIRRVDVAFQLWRCHLSSKFNCIDTYSIYVRTSKMTTKIGLGVPMPILAPATASWTVPFAAMYLVLQNRIVYHRLNTKTYVSTSSSSKITPDLNKTELKQSTYPSLAICTCHTNPDLEIYGF